MRKVLSIQFLLLALGAACAREWMGIRRPAAPAPAATAPAPDPVAPVPAQRADTAWIDRAVRSLPVGAPGAFLGTLEGVRCFNCTPGTVQLNLGDTLTREAGLLTFRTEIWNAIERPIRDRRVYDHANACVYFGYKAVDTVYVGGELTEIRLRDVPCYPYLQRIAYTGKAPRTDAPIPAPTAPAPAAPATPAASAAHVAPLPSDTTSQALQAGEDD